MDLAMQRCGVMMGGQRGKKGVCGNGEGNPDPSSWEIRSLLSRGSIIQETKLSPLGLPLEVWLSAQADKRDLCGH